MNTKMPLWASLKNHTGLWLALLIGLLLKIILLITDSVTFNSDEAILGLMAKNILSHGERPIFFYGQLYMGAIDAYFVAAAFAIFGQTVTVIRLVQIILYLATLATTYLLALRITADRFAATAAALLYAIPPVLISLYTTATLGDYQEILLLNNLIFLIVWDILSGKKQSKGWWFVAGILAGIGWWSLALIIVSLGPLTLQGLWHFRRKLPVQKIGVLIIGFVIGAAPWFYAVVDHGPQEVIGSQSDAATRSNTLEDTALSGAGKQIVHLTSLLLFNVPALFGLRPPWSIEWIAPLLGIPIAIIYLTLVWRAIRRTWTREQPPDQQLALTSILIGAGVLMLIYVMFPSGGDFTGRYVMPIYPLLAVLIGEWLGRVRRGQEIVPQQQAGSYGSWVAGFLLILFLVYNLYGNVRSINDNPPGLTTQYDPVSHIPHDYDDALIDFLDSIGVDRGYSNYWLTYRFAFLTDQRILLIPRLPYKKDMSFNIEDDRYAPYPEKVAEAENVVYITSNLEELDRQLRERFVTLQIDFDEKSIGPYTIFYNFPRHVGPEALAPFETPPE